MTKTTLRPTTRTFWTTQKTTIPTRKITTGVADTCCRNIYIGDGNFGETYQKIGNVYKSTNKFIIWSKEVFSWISIKNIKPDGKYTSVDVGMRILASNSDCLLQKSGRSKRALFSRNFNDDVFRIFDDKTNKWKESNIQMQCK